MFKPIDDTTLAFALLLVNGFTIKTIGGAAQYFSGLDQERREKFPWSTAILMLHTAMKEPVYLKTATINLQTALAMDGVLVSPYPGVA